MNDKIFHMHRVAMLFIAFLFLPLVALYPQEKGARVLLKTEMGDVKVLLYDETPKHRDNYLKLIRKDFYDSLLFHRVIKDFMLQAGDPESKYADSSKRLGQGGPGYTIQAEIQDDLFHKRGVLSAARRGDQVNPERKSSGSQFFIVQGKTYSHSDLDRVEKSINHKTQNQEIHRIMRDPDNKAFMNKVRRAEKDNDTARLQKLNLQFKQMVRERMADKEPFRFSDEQREIYSTIGGAPHLDQQYTVFGEVVEGMEVVDQISSVPTDQNNRPLKDIRILDVIIIE